MKELRRKIREIILEVGFRPNDNLNAPDKYNSDNNVDTSKPIYYIGTTETKGGFIRKNGFGGEKNINITTDKSDLTNCEDIIKVRLKKGAKFRPGVPGMKLDNIDDVVIDYSETIPLIDTENILEGIDVFHGSDRKFDTFDVNKIGSGDGKQLGGWGIYFSDSEDVSQRYVTRHGFLKQYEIKSGSYFDLDDSLDSETSFIILNGLKRKNVSENDLEQFQNDFIEYANDTTNKQVYEWLSHVLGGEKQASLFLEERGFLGNKFKDRINTEATNYVVFNSRNVVEI